MKSETSFRVFFLKQHRKNSLKNIFSSQKVYFWISAFDHRAIVLPKMHIVHWPKKIWAQLFQSPETPLVNGRTCGVRFSSGSISNATRKIAINRNISKIQILDRAVEMNCAGVCWTLTLSGLDQMSNIKWKINGKLCTYKGLFINDVIAFGRYRDPQPPPPRFHHVIFRLPPTPSPLFVHINYEKNRSVTKQHTPGRWWLSFQVSCSFHVLVW